MMASCEKSNTSTVEIAEGVRLDGRLAIIHDDEGWLAASDLHFGYEVSRRARGGLFPQWGMATVEERLAQLIDDHSPETLILVGDVVDSASAVDAAVDWLERVAAKVDSLILVEGNHDRGAIRKRFAFCESFATGDGYFFHHGHRELRVPPESIEIIGHLHPSRHLGDGAGLSLRLPALVQEQCGAGERWILPAFSPWAGGGRFHPSEEADVTEWICHPQRVFRYEV